MLTVLAADLRLRNDELSGIAIVRARQGVLQDANRPQNVADNLGLAWEVRGIGNDHASLGLELHLVHTRHGSLNANGLVTIVLELINMRVKHVRASINGRQTGEALGQLAETVERVDVRGLSVAGDRVAVELDTLDDLGSLSLGGDVVVGEVQGHGMTDEVTGSRLETELVVHLLHRNVVDVQTLVGSRVLGVERTDPLHEALHAALLEDTHQGGLESLASIRGDLGDGGLGAGALLDVAAGNLLEFEVAGDVGGYEDVGQLAGRHEELGNEVDVPVVESTVLLPWLLAGAVVAVLLEELS